MWVRPRIRESGALADNGAPPVNSCKEGSSSSGASSAAWATANCAESANLAWRPFGATMKIVATLADTWGPSCRNDRMLRLPFASVREERDREHHLPAANRRVRSAFQRRTGQDQLRASGSAISGEVAEASGRLARTYDVSLRLEQRLRGSQVASLR